MLGSDVKLIEYSRRVDLGNSITHGAGAIAAVIGFFFLVAEANGLRGIISAVVYGLSIIAVYTVSSVYHGLPIGEAKRKARLIDHSTVPVLIAGTATPCALMTLWNLSIPHTVFVLAVGWGCTLFGIFSKLFFFEKLKKVTVAVYIISSVAMLLTAIPFLGRIRSDAFGGLLLGNAFYLVGALFCAIGRKHPTMHVVFHVFTVIGSAVHYFVILLFVL